MWACPAARGGCANLHRGPTSIRARPTRAAENVATVARPKGARRLGCRAPQPHHSPHLGNAPSKQRGERAWWQICPGVTRAAACGPGVACVARRGLGRLSAHLRQAEARPRPCRSCLERSSAADLDERHALRRGGCVAGATGGGGAAAAATTVAAAAMAAATAATAVAAAAAAVATARRRPRRWRRRWRW